LNQAVGLERYELLGKMQGVDVWDMKPLDSSRIGNKRLPIKPALLTTNQAPWTTPL
jgi:cytochrome c oxidase subunit 5b